MAEGSEEKQTSSEYLSQTEQAERIEEIEKGIIDIEAYKGLIQVSQVANIEGVLTEGIKSGEVTSGK